MFLICTISAEPKNVAKSKIDLFGLESSDDENENENENADDDDENEDEEEEAEQGNGKKSSSQTTSKVKKVKTNMNSADEINAFRNRLQIKAKGNNIPNPAATFTDMNIFPELKPIIIANIEESTWKEPTPIQMQAIPIMLEGTYCTYIIIW